MARPRLLYVASRWPWPVATGRQRMIDQYLRFAAWEYDVTLAYFDGKGDGAAAPGGLLSDAQPLPLPGVAEIAGNLVRRRCVTLQECLFRSADAKRLLSELICRVRPEVALFDMIRTAQYQDELVAARPCRRLADLDDLLSDRYAQFERGGGASILGNFASAFPPAVGQAAGLLAGPLCRIESRLMDRREREIADQFDQVLLVSGAEAARLRDRTGRTNIASAPPAVSAYPEPAPWPDRGPSFVFLGSARYPANREALLALDEVGGRLADRGLDVTFEAIGETAPGLDLPHVRMLGFVANLDARLGPGTVLVAPIMSGSGVKTKVLDAMARGVPVVTTPKGMEGLDAVPGHDAVVSDTVEDLATAVFDAIENPGHLEAVGRSGQHYALQAHWENRLRERFLALLRGEVPVEVAG